MKLITAIFSFLFSHIALAQQSCDSACQQAFKQAQAGESASWVSQSLSSEEFYSRPANASCAKPGELLRWEDLSRENVNRNFSNPTGTSISRFLYMTEDVDRKPIPASGFVLLPYRKPDPGKPFKTLVWTHGTAGRIRNCAPSNHRDLYYGWSGPYALVQAGYAVIAPDYAGQGSDIPQGFMYEAGFLHAADAAYGLIAARKVLGDILSDEWLVVGHSEGGMSAWRTNERLAMPEQEELLKAGRFLGAVANAPALRPLDLIPESIRRAAGGPIGDAVSVLFMQSLAQLFPNEFHLQDYLSHTALARIPLMDQGCLNTAEALFSNLTAQQIWTNTSWLELPVIVDWQKRYNGAGPHALAAPMLVVQGIADILVYANNTEIDFNRTCKAFPQSDATLLLYQGVDHDVASTAPQADFLAWIDDRFAGEKVKRGCTIHTIEPVTDNFKNMRSA